MKTSLMSSTLLFFFLLPFVSGRLLFLSPITGDNNSTDCFLQKPCLDLAYALTLAQTGDSIQLLPGNYSGPRNRGLTLQVILTIRGVEGNGETIIDLTNSDRFMTISGQGELTLEGVTIQNGQTTTSGGAIVAKAGSDLTITQSNFIRNSAANLRGGAIYAEKGVDIIISSSFFQYNSAGLGGAIYNLVGNLLIDSTTFDSNFASTSYGAINSNGATFNLTNSIFTSNMARQEGGAIGLSGYYVFFSSVIFQNNTGPAGGGCLTAFSGHLELQDILFEYCQTNGRGGGMFVDLDAGVNCNNCTFRNNFGLTRGGGFYCTSGFVKLNNSLVQNNYALGSGGGVAMSTCKANLTNTLLVSNSEGDAALFVDYTTILGLNNVSIVNNKGMGIFCSNSKIWVHDSVVVNNTDIPLYCSDLPSYTFCTITGDSGWNGLCGEQTPEKPPVTFPILVIIGIIMGVCGIIICIISVIACRKMRKQYRATDKGIWERVNVDEEKDFD